MKTFLITSCLALFTQTLLGSVIAWEGQIVPMRENNQITYIDLGEIGIVPGNEEILTVSNLTIGQDYYMTARVSGGGIANGWLPLSWRTEFKAVDETFSMKARNKSGNIDDWVIEQVAIVPAGQVLDVDQVLTYDVNNSDYVKREMQFYAFGQDLKQGSGDVGWVATPASIPEPNSVLLILLSSFILIIRKRN